MKQFSFRTYTEKDLVRQLTLQTIPLQQVYHLHELQKTMCRGMVEVCTEHLMHCEMQQLTADQKLQGLGPEKKTKLPFSDENL